MSPVPRSSCPPVARDPLVHRPVDAAWLAHRITAAPQQEWFVLLGLDRQQRIVTTQVLAIGPTCPLPIDPPAVLQVARHAQAASVITVRYHPHGGPFRPDRANCRVQQLLIASAAVGIPLLDHLIVCGDQALVSFRALRQALADYEGG